jgi:S1-C subfamily serine protease
MSSVAQRYPAIPSDRYRPEVRLLSVLLGRAHRPGDRLRLTFERGGTEREVSLVLGASKQN